MKIKLIACEALTREFCLATAASPHVFDLKFMSFGLHNTPTELRTAIQAEIDACESSGFDAIVLGYGLCSRGTAEVRAGSIPIVIPRAHDCITFFLGSRARYSREFGGHPGTYYYSSGWIERKVGDIQQGFVDEEQAQRTRSRYEEYVEKYGEDNAEFLMEQESLWVAHYDRAAFINMGLGDIDDYRRHVRQLAADNGWEYAELEGDMSLITRLANGDWDSEDFLRVPPGHSVGESFDDLVLISIQRDGEGG